MRELAKILMEIQKIDCSVQNLFQALNPRNYKHLVTATKIIANYDPETEIYLSSTFAINMGTTLNLRTTIQLIEGHWMIRSKSFCFGGCKNVLCIQPRSLFGPTARPVEPFKHSHRNITFDNWSSNYPLITKLLNDYELATEEL